MLFLGVDPGKKGGFAVIDSGSGEQSAFAWDEKSFLSTAAYLGELEREHKGSVFGCVEAVSAMPKQGVTSTFSFGQSYGWIQGVLEANQIPFELVRPQKWKKAFSVTADKNTSISVCRRLFPTVSLLANERCKTPSDGMAESLLLALYGRRLCGEGDGTAAKEAEET